MTGTADILWEDMVLSMLGETIEEDGEICGCRVVDRFRKGMLKPVYRLEMWLRVGVLRVNKDVEDRVKARLLQALADGDSHRLTLLPELEYKPRS